MADNMESTKITKLLNGSDEVNECPPTSMGPSCLPVNVDCIFPSTHSGSLHSYRPSVPPQQPLTALPLVSHFLPTLALNSHGRLQYTNKFFPPKRTHSLQGRKQGMMSLWRKMSPKNRGSRMKRMREHTSTTTTTVCPSRSHGDPKISKD